MLRNALLLIFLAIGSTGCTALYMYETSSAGRYGGEPADRSRVRQPDGTLIEYDAARKLYRVVGRQGYYYHMGSYYRKARGRWEVTETMSGEWRVVSKEMLPRGLRL